MKHLKLFENSKIEETSDPRWSNYTKEMHKRFFDICMPNRDSDFQTEDIKPFFKMLEKEYLESDEWITFEVYQTFRSGSKTFYGLANARGPIEACLKMALHYEDPYLIPDLDDLSIYEVEEETIDGNISRLESEIEKWKNIL
jgi:hypothetical protein